MSGGGDALRGVFEEAVRALAPLVDAAQSPDDFTHLLADLGWTMSSLPQPILDLAGAGATLINALGSEPDEITTDQIVASIARLLTAVDGIRAQPDSVFPSTVDVASFKQTIGRDLLDYCIVEYALRSQFRIGRLLKLAGIIRLIEMPASGLRRSHLRRHVEWGRIGTLLTDPTEGFREAYGWTSAAPQVRDAVSDIAAVLEAYGFQFSYFRLTPEQLAFANADADAAHAITDDLGIVLDLGQAFGIPVGSEAGIRFIVRAATPRRSEALALVPFSSLSSTTETAVDPGVSLSIVGDADLARGVAVTLAPGQDPELEAGFLGGSPVPPPARVGLQVTIAPPPDEPERVLVGTVDGSRLATHTITASLGAALVARSRVDAFAEVALDRLRVVVKPDADESDSFLESLLGSDGVSAEFSVTVRFSSVTGFHLKGAGGLAGSFPVGVRLGPVDIQSISMAVAPSADGVALDVGATLATRIGPISVVVDRVGFRVTARFPDPPTGNLGPVDLAFGFAPPSGVGLSVDVRGVITGGGFLFHDAAEGAYAGVLQLSLYEQITVTAVGLVATRMPDGSRGFSLLIFITAEDFRPIPLGLGFTLQGIGGIVAVHRTFNEDVLRGGLENGTLGSLLFPRDPVRNAPAIIRALASAFPAQRGSYLLGLLARIGWASPTLVQMDLALTLEFGARRRLLVLGRISSLLPSRENDLLRLNIDAIGVIDFDQGTAALDGVLVDSRLVHTYVLTGAMALRARWKSGPGSAFVLAIGGLNPRFAPPAGLPPMTRLTIALSSGTNPRLTCAAYFAITANTVQFGARAQLYAAAFGFSIEGDIGYDVLLQITPLHFIADFHASVQLKRGSRNLFKVSVKGELEGPRPLRVSGKASFEVLWCDFSIRFDKTLIDGEKPPLPPAIDVLAQLTRALSTAESWSTLTAVRETHGVSLRKLPAGGAPVLDPLGRLMVKQQVVPLNTARDIDSFGGAPVRGARRFRIAATLNGRTQQVQPVREQFAPAQFFAFTDEEKLVAPSFEEMDAGIAFGSGASDFDAAEVVAAPLAYESIVVDSLEAPSAPPEPNYSLPVDLLVAHSRSGAAARAPARRVGFSRFSDKNMPPAVSLRPNRWSIVPLAEGPPAQLDANVTTWSEYRAALAVLNRGGARWQIVPAHELAT